MGRVFKELEIIERADGVVGGFDNLGDFMRLAILPLHARLVNNPDTEKVVIVLVGEPRAGKTFWENQVLSIAAEWTGAISPLVPKIEDIKRISWEIHGEDLARQRHPDIFITPLGKPLTPLELACANDTVQEEMVKAVNSSHLVVIELPASSAVLLPDEGEESDYGLIRNGPWLGRSLGSEPLYNLVRREGPFKGLNFRDFVAGLIPDYSISERALAQRIALKSAETAEEILKEAIEMGLLMRNTELIYPYWTKDEVAHRKEEKPYINYVTVEDLDALKREGASDEEIKNLTAKTRRLMAVEVKRGVLNPTSLFRELKEADIEGIEEVLEGSWAQEMFLKGAHLERFFTKDLGIREDDFGNWNMVENRYFIGRNRLLRKNEEVKL